MAKLNDYDERWHRLLTKAAGGDRNALSDMTPKKEDETILVAFRHFLLECYEDQVKLELGNALTPTRDKDALRMKVVSLHHWKFNDVEKMGTNALIGALIEQLAHFKLPIDAVETVQNLMERRPFLAHALAHHRPARVADQ
ncbi:hypothetical protein [Vreelandella populi]|uniref:Uncharacterized protein n=1 Tax=Vreelandella populi TaxID=2498858 RepID=A0A3S0WKZ5_9GAMM|nr:hypothetical protein [Halomonas populi]RUR43343.1 hypothetical protein ELY37_16635 [Halomonas populi]